MSSPKTSTITTSTTSLTDINKLLFERKGLEDDIVIKLRDGSQLHVYEPIITLQSEVFAKMLAADMKEKETGSIDMSAHKVGTVRSMFKYFYSHEFDFEGTQVSEWFDFLEILAMFDLEQFYEWVEYDICNRCGVNNVFEVLAECLQRVNLTTIKIDSVIKNVLSKNLVDMIINNRKREETNSVNWSKYGYTCYDQIAPGTVKNDVLLREKGCKHYMCCEHYRSITRDYLEMPHDRLKHEGTYLCIAYTCEGNDPKNRECVKVFCCKHGDIKAVSDGNKLLDDLVKQPESVQLYILKMLFGM